MSELDDLRKELDAANKRIADVEAGVRARNDAERWAADNPDFYQCRANANAMAEEIQQRGLPFVYDSFAAVYADLKDKLEQAPTAETQPQTATEEPAKLSKSDREFLGWANSLSASDFARQVIANKANFARFNKLTPPAQPIGG